MKKDPSYKYVPIDPWEDHDWERIMKKYLPEQQQRTRGREQEGGLVKNDTLLVLANPFFMGSRKSHYTSARWWVRFVEKCAQQTDVHSYGCVRMIAFMPQHEAEIILPRSVRDRRGPSLMTEAFTSNVFEVASANEVGEWVTRKPYSLIMKEMTRVAERAAESGVVTPAGRERRPIACIPEEYQCLHKGTRHVPLPMYGQAAALVAILSAPETARNTNAKKGLTRHTLASKARRLEGAMELVEHREKIDEFSKILARRAADPKVDLSELKELNSKISSMRSFSGGDHDDKLLKLRKEYGKLKPAEILYDGIRAAGDFDNAVLLHERRPFEPLQIDPEEVFPTQVPSSIIYFEADLNSSLAQKIKQTPAEPPSDRDDLISMMDALLPSLLSSTERTIPKLFELLFPTRPVNDIVRVIPGLAKFAGSKTLKPDFEHLPKTIIPDPYDKEVAVTAGKEFIPDPAASFQENIDYDFTEIRVRVLPVHIMIDILLEYQKLPVKLPMIPLVRHLGGAVTSPVATTSVFTGRKW